MNFDRIINRRKTDSLKWDLGELKYGDQVLPMWVADMDFTCPDPVIQALEERARQGIFGYTLQQDSYFDAVCSWYNRRHGLGIDRSQVFYSPGVCAAISTVLRTFTRPGDRVLIQSPIYYPFFQLTEENGRIPVFNELQEKQGRYTIDFADFEEKAASGVKLFLLCSPHNPTGRVWSREELDRMGQICARHGILVLSDEIHCDIVYPGAVHIPFLTLDNPAAGSSITCTAPSKTFNLAGLATSHVLIKDKALQKAYARELHAAGIFGAPVFGAEAVKACYTRGEAWLDELMVYLTQNLDFLISYVHSHLAPVKVIRPEATYLVWLDFRELGMDHRELSRLLLDKGRLWLNDGHIFGPGGDGFERINIACPRPVLAEGLERIRTALGRN